MIFPNCRWYSTIVRKGQRKPRTHWESQLAESTDDAEDRADLWSIHGDIIHRHRDELRIQLHVPKEDTFPIPLEYNADLHVLQEKRIDDCWNVDANRHLDSQSSLYWKRNVQRDMWSGERLTKIQATTRPDHVWPEVWTKIGKAAAKRETQERTREKPKLDNACRLRGIYFIDPDDKEYAEILKTARRKWERPMAPTMLCQWRAPNGITKVLAQSETASEKTPTTIFDCVLEPHESTRQRVESSQHKNHRDHFGGKGFTPMTQYNLVHNFISSDENSGCKSCNG